VRVEKDVNPKYCSSSCVNFCRQYRLGFTHSVLEEFQHRRRQPILWIDLSERTMGLS